MLVRITNRCSMGCIHCLTDASPSGQHMDWATFCSSVQMSLDLETMRMLMISGGEPTEHPDILRYIDHANKLGFVVVLTSNGTFVDDEQLTEQLLSRDILIQVTNDRRYYPRSVRMIEHRRVCYEETLRMISPFGRALGNGLPVTQTFPSCFNLRSVTRSTGDVRLALAFLRSKARFCVPSVNVDGTLVAGEAPSCAVIGSVFSSPEDVTKRVIGTSCGRCGLVGNLSQKQKLAIGEALVVPSREIP